MDEVLNLISAFVTGLLNWARDSANSIRGLDSRTQDIYASKIASMDRKVIIAV